MISRGLLDVLPDEASLAMVLAHELSHIVLGHSSTPSWHSTTACSSPMKSRSSAWTSNARPADEEAADTKALELLKNSPYKDKLGTRWIISEGIAGDVLPICRT